MKIPDVTERRRLDSVGRTRASNIVYTIWAVWGGFILHFLLANYLTVLLRPRYEEPVDTAADLINRDITPFCQPGSQISKQVFAASPDPNYQELSRRLIVAKDWYEYLDMLSKVISTGLYADIGNIPTRYFVKEAEHKKWYRSSEIVAGNGDTGYGVHLINKKWPLKKVLSICIKNYNVEHFTFRNIILISLDSHR